MINRLEKGERRYYGFVRLTSSWMEFWSSISWIWLEFCWLWLAECGGLFFVVLRKTLMMKETILISTRVKRAEAQSIRNVRAVIVVGSPSENFWKRVSNPIKRAVEASIGKVCFATGFPIFRTIPFLEAPHLGCLDCAIWRKRKKKMIVKIIGDWIGLGYRVLQKKKMMDAMMMKRIKRGKR